MSERSGRARRFLARARRGRAAEPQPHAHAQPSDAVGWDAPATAPPAEPAAEPERPAPLEARVLALFGDPRIDGITARTAARLLSVSPAEAEATLDALATAGVLVREGETIPRYVPSDETKAKLEDLYRQTAYALGETTALAPRDAPDALAVLDEDEPRLPITAGLLSLFLPGTGQLLNGDVGRASLVFAVWSLAWITHLSPIWSFVCLYAGAEAFFTAKIRGMERKLAREAAAKARAEALARGLPAEPT